MKYRHRYFSGVGLLLIILLVATTPVLADITSTTPASYSAGDIQPFAYELDEAINAGDGLGDAGYSVSSMIDNTWPDDEVNDSDIYIPDVLTEFGANNGFLNIFTHGADEGDDGGFPGGIAIESFPYTEDGRIARDFWYTLYRNSGYSDVVFRGGIEDVAYSIGLKYNDGLANRVNMADGIVLLNACNAQNSDYHDWTGSRVVATCSGVIDAGEAISNINCFFSGVNSQYGYRSVGEVCEDCSGLSKSGHGWTTITPGVYDTSHSYNDPVPAGGLDFWFEFDTRVNHYVPASQAIFTTGILQVDSAWWESDTKLYAHISTTGVGTGQVIASGNTIYSANCSNIFLYGGYSDMVTLRHPDEPAADVNSFGVIDGQAEWMAETEHNTLSYEIWASHSKDGPWEVVATIQAGQYNGYKVNVPEGYSYYQLVEIETTGKQIFHDMAKSATRSTKSSIPMPSKAELLNKLEELQQMRDEMGGPPLPLMGDGQKLVIYTVEALAEATQYAIANYWHDWWNYETLVKTVDDFPADNDLFRQTLQADIATEKDNGTDYFLLVGDSNDWEAWTADWGPEWQFAKDYYLNQGYPPEGQPELDLIPTYIVWDTRPRGEGMPWFVPYYFTDKPYWDTDCDGSSDVVGGRLPFSSEEQVYAYGYKLQYASQFGDFGAHLSGHYTRDTDYDDYGDGAFALQVANVLKDLVPPSIPQIDMLHSDYPVTSERNDQAAQLWNMYAFEVLTLISPLSNRSRPGDNFVQTDPSNPWTMDMIQPYGNHAPLILAGSCDGADWARTEKPAYGRPIGERFLERDYGAIAWVGPTIGTWQAPNMTVLSYFMEEVWNNLDRSLAESFMIAEQRIRTDYPDSEDVLQVLDSYIFLGDPLTRLNHLRVPTPVEDEQAPRKLALQNNYPNPFNPTTAINFAVHKRSHVKLTIHDLSGRLIDTLVDEIRAPGDYVVEWHGSDHRDRRAASGVYFYSLICNGQKLTKKMTLLK